jgi:DNA-directed RNA polymerase specialized sigma24 family protein
VVRRWSGHGLARGEYRLRQRFVIEGIAAADAGEELLSAEASGTNSALGLAWDAGRMGSDYEFEQFVRTIEPGLRRALTGHLAREAVADALAEAFAYAWEHWDRVMHLEHPTGYLFRVAQSKVRIRKQGFLPWSSRDATPDVEPALVGALAGLSPAQSRAVWLVHACGWTYAETGEALHMSPSTVGSHVSRALGHLREQLGVAVDG